MALSGIDNVDCSGLAALLQSTNVSELEGTILSIEKHYPHLARRIVLALGGYNSEVSPVGLGNRTEWTELVRSGFCFALGFQQVAVAASLSNITLVTNNTLATMVRSILISAPVATEIAITDAFGVGAALYAGLPVNLLHSGPAALNSLFVGGTPFAGNIYRRFFIPANTPVELSRESLEITHSSKTIGVFNLTANQALDVTFEWAEVPATWPL